MGFAPGRSVTFELTHYRQLALFALLWHNSAVWTGPLDEYPGRFCAAKGSKPSDEAEFELNLRTVATFTGHLGRESAIPLASSRRGAFAGQVPTISNDIRR